MARVLVVEDDPAQREVLAVTLLADGYEVDEAEDGREALSRLWYRRPDLIVLDLALPVMDGVAFLEALLHEPIGVGVPVVVVSGYTDRVEGLPPRQIRGMLAKPLDYERLRELVRNIVRERMH